MLKEKLIVAGFKARKEGQAFSLIKGARLYSTQDRKVLLNQGTVAIVKDMKEEDGDIILLFDIAGLEFALALRYCHRIFGSSLKEWIDELELAGFAAQYEVKRLEEAQKREDDESFGAWG